MRRPAAAVLGTLAGTALLVSAKIGTQPATDPGGQAAGLTADVAIDPSTTGDPQTTARPTAAGSPGATVQPSGPASGPSTAAPRTTSGTATTGAATTAPASGTTTAATGTSLKSGTYPGSTVTHKYGTLRVTITVSNGKITAITESYATSLAVSEKINKDALPKLRQEALAAQSARIDTVSGATYTSTAYRTSLQGAIDRAAG